MTSQFGSERSKEPQDTSSSTPLNNDTRLNSDSRPPEEAPLEESPHQELKAPEVHFDAEYPLTIDGVRARITSALSQWNHESEIDLSSSLLHPFIDADGANQDHIVTLNALLHAANGYFRTPEADDALISVLEIAQKALTYWYIPRPEFEEVRSKWFGFIDTVLQSEQCDIGDALSTNDELRLMATAKLLGIAKRILEIDGDRNTLDTSDFSFSVAEGCRAITKYLTYSDIKLSISDLVWLTVGELADNAGLLASTSLDTPLLNLFEKAVMIAGYEEEFLPYHRPEGGEEVDDDEDFSESLEIKFKESQGDDGDYLEEDVSDSLEGDDGDYLEENEVEQKMEPDDEYEEVPEEELQTEDAPQPEMPVYFSESTPNADFGVTRLLYGLAKCQPRIPGNADREHLWSCAISSFSFEHPSWNAGVLGMWTVNEERAKGVVRSLLLQVFDWESDEWEGENKKKDLPDEDDTFALLVELLAREPQTAEGLEEVFRDLPREVQLSISDICQDALEKGDIPVEWFDAGCRDVNKFEEEIARIFIIPTL
jgi:hypothetical protein